MLLDKKETKEREMERQEGLRRLLPPYYDSVHSALRVVHAQG